jgi:hypothetical protein
MDKDQAIRDVQEIKEVMQESRKRSGRGKYLIGPALALAAIIVSSIVPYLAPIMAIGLLVGGVITWRRNSETLMKVISVGIFAAGIVLIIMFILAMVGPGAYLFSSPGGPESAVTTTPLLNPVSND